jgi:hypothetical protein
MAEQSGADNRITERLTVSEAAARLGISEGAVRGRINRGTLEADRESGTVYVLLYGEHTADTQKTTGGYPGEYNALTSALEARIESLERQLEEARERDRENRRLLAAALERIPPQLEAPSEPRESPETATEGVEPRPGGVQEGAERPWWSRWFGRWVKMRSDPGVRHNITLLAVLVGILVAGYTLVVLLFAPGDLLGWVSTLVSTVASVWAALLIGLILFQHQTQETDRKKKEELAELLKTELGEVRRVIGRLRTDVQEEALETTENSFTSHGMQYVLHYTHPLIVEEAARSGLFDTEQTSEMLVLARTMRQHNVC